MEDSDDYEYDESTVVVEINGIIEQDFLRKVSQAKVLGIDSDQPLIQLDDYTFQGGYSDTVGTDMVFKEVPVQGVSTQQFSGETKQEVMKKVELSCLTNKKLCVQRVFLKSNKPAETASAATSGNQSAAEELVPASEGDSQEPVDTNSMEPTGE